MITRRFFKKILTPAEAGKRGTHEIYIRLSNDFDYESFFQQAGYMNGSVLQIDFEAKDLCEGHEEDDPVKFKFVFYKNSNHEKRIPSLGDFFRNHDIQDGDIIVLESRTQDEKTEFFFSHFKPSEMVLKPDTIYYTETIQDRIKYTHTNNIKIGLQKIYYGAPGTGKSFGVKLDVGTKDDTDDGEMREDNNIRITFHPDIDYASFVGCYKPMRDEDDPKLIVYKYQPQAFIKAYVNAWTIYLDDLTEDKNYYLIIEEINRGNCAQIFGDMFQLLDREDNGYSSYKVSPDSDLQMYLEEAFNDVDFSSEEDGEELKKGTRMQLPPNLSILATMNTSDQSLFPMDSAFKRRWDWDYVKIDTSKVKELYFKVGDSLYSWADFVNSINKYIQDNNGSTAKQIGPWFAKADDDEVDGKPTTISYDKFCSKVLFYLFNDALRDFDPFGTLFQTKDDDDSVNFFFENLFEKEDKGVANVEHFLEELPNQIGIKIEKKSTEGQADTTDKGQDD